MLTLISWIDRNFNLLFNKDKCLILNWYTFEGKDLCKYNTIVKDPFGHKFRSLGKSWFKALPLLLLPLFSFSQPVEFDRYDIDTLGISPFYEPYDTIPTLFLLSKRLDETSDVFSTETFALYGLTIRYKRSEFGLLHKYVDAYFNELDSKYIIWDYRVTNIR